MTNPLYKFLPKEIPLLVRRGTIIFPKAKMPILLEDENEKFIINQSFKNQQFIGIIQPAGSTKNEKGIVLYSSGTLCKIVELVEDKDLTTFALLEGICRFDVKSLKFDKFSKTVSSKVSYTRFKRDLDAEKETSLDRKKLLTSMMKLGPSNFEKDSLLEDFTKVSTPKLLALIGMTSPFNPSEKQAALEAINQKDLSQVIFSLLDMACYDTVLHHSLH